MNALWNTTKTFLLLSALTALAGGIGFVFGGIKWAMGAILVMGLVNFFMYMVSDQLVLSMHHGQLVNERELPWLHEIVERLASRANIQKPALYIVEDPAPNAFATGRSPSLGVVAVTTGLLELCDRREIEGVLAHEIAHIVHRDMLVSTIAATLAGAISLLAHMAGYLMLFAGRSSDEDGPNPLALLVFMILAPLAAALIQMAISRTREYEADRLGAVLVGNPRGLASALSKLGSYHARRPARHADPAFSHLYISMPRMRGGLETLFATHPPIEERIRRLLEMNA